MAATNGTMCIKGVRQSSTGEGSEVGGWVPR